MIFNIDACKKSAEIVAEISEDTFCKIKKIKAQYNGLRNKRGHLSEENQAKMDEEIKSKKDEWLILASNEWAKHDN